MAMRRSIKLRTIYANFRSNVLFLYVFYITWDLESRTRLVDLKSTLHLVRNENSRNLVS